MLAALGTLENLSASTLAGGYAVDQIKGNTVYFTAGSASDEKRNDKGRCTAVTYTYADGSQIKFTWNERDGSRYREVEKEDRFAFLR